MGDICFIVNKYPNKFEPNILVFVQQLIWAIADNGIKCTVICPLAYNLNPKYLSLPYHSTEVTDTGKEIELYFPKFFGLGQAKKVFGKSVAPFTINRFTRSIIRTIDKNHITPSAIYSHFITPAGIAASRISRKYNIPAFMAYGEATFKTINEFGEENVKKELASLAGVIAVSSQNRNMLLSIDAVPSNKIKVFPNGYRPERFYPRDKVESRKKFGLPLDSYIVGMVGSFDERKGILRLQAAVDKLDGVSFICAGKGNLQPTSRKCLFAKPVSNHEMPYFYSAMDVFVLPTLNEGCCNAIIEALACACPIISSNRSFNFDILDETCALLVDPENVDQIRDAIKFLKDNSSKRESLSKGSLYKATQFTLKNRSKNIINYISENSKSTRRTFDEDLFKE